MASSISSKLIPCLRNFKALLARTELAAYEAEVPHAAWQDEMGRLRIWAANIGAHQTGQSSLDYRLRDASHISQQILKLLDDLSFTLKEIEEVLDNGPLLEEDFDGEAETEIQELCRGLSNIIKCLYQMSMLIRKPARNDRLRQYHEDNSTAFQPFDRDHVANKYPGADSAIVERLGLAISRRRAILRYRERHHAKLGQGIEHADDDTMPESKSVVLSQTVATDYKENMGLDLGDVASTSGQSQTSYAPSLEGGGAICVPPPPKEAAGEQLFQCPYCYYIITIKNRRSWTRHLFKDIMPYICIFPNCPTPHKMYDSRHEWFNHEVKVHLKVQMPSDATSEIDCGLCRSTGTVAQLERHLARHLEELALFALPRGFSGEDEDSDKSRNSSVELGIDKEDLSSISEGNVELPTNDSQLPSDHVPEEPTYNITKDDRDFIPEPLPRSDSLDSRDVYDRDDMDIDPPSSTRLASYFLPGGGISREVIQADICRYLGADATCVPTHNREGAPGYLIRARRMLTTKMVEDLMADSKRWDEELRRSGPRGTRPAYEDSKIHKRRQ